MRSRRLSTVTPPTRSAALFLSDISAPHVGKPAARALLLISRMEACRSPPKKTIDLYRTRRRLYVGRSRISAARSDRDGQSRLRLDAFQGETRCHILERYRLDEALIERIEAFRVRYDHAEQIIIVARHAVDVEHFVHGRDRLRKRIELLAGVVADFDCNEGCDHEPELLRIDQSDTPPNDALLLEDLNPSPARCGRKPHLRRDLGNGQARVRLHDLQDFAICRVHKFLCPIQPVKFPSYTYIVHK